MVVKLNRTFKRVRIFSCITSARCSPPAGGGAALHFHSLTDQKQLLGPNQSQKTQINKKSPCWKDVKMFQTQRNQNCPRRGAEDKMEARRRIDGGETLFPSLILSPADSDWPNTPSVNPLKQTALLEKHWLELPLPAIIQSRYGTIPTPTVSLFFCTSHSAPFVPGTLRTSWRVGKQTPRWTQVSPAHSRYRLARFHRPSRAPEVDHI